MKRCPECRRDYHDDSLKYCLDDGTALLEGPASFGDAATVSLRPGESAPGAGETATRLYGDSVTRRTRTRNLPAALIVAGLAVAAVLGYGAYRYLGSKDPAQPPRSAANLETRRLTGDGKTNEAAISPDGKVLAYTRIDGESWSLWIKQIATDSSIQVPTSSDLAQFTSLRFSPDGEFIYFNGAGTAGGPPTIYRVPILGGAPARVLVNATDVSFSPNGKRIAFGRVDQSTSESSIFVADVNGSGERRLAARKGKKFFNSGPVWSPDGKYVAVSTGDDDLLPNPDEGVVLISVDDGAEREVGTAKWASVTSVAWHPSGDSLIVAASDYDVVPGQLWEVSYPSGETRRLTNNLNGYQRVSMTADGKSIITMERYSRSAAWVSPDLDPAKAKRVMPDTGDTWGLAWMPDGRIVYASDQSGDAEVWVMNADGTDARQLTRDRVFKGFPDASSDGSWIVYSSADLGGRIKRISITDPNPAVVTETGFGQDNPDISPDDRWVVFSAWVDGTQRVLRAPLAGGEATVLTGDAVATEPRYSPDGTRFACLHIADPARPMLAIYPAEGGPPEKVLETPPGTVAHRGPLWTPDGRGVNLLVQRGDRSDLWVQPVDGGPAKQVTDFELPYIARRAYSRDGKRIALIRADNIRNAVMITNFR